MDKLKIENRKMLYCLVDGTHTIVFLDGIATSCQVASCIFVKPCRELFR